MTVPRTRTKMLPFFTYIDIRGDVEIDNYSGREAIIIVIFNLDVHSHSDIEIHVILLDYEFGTVRSFDNQLHFALRLIHLAEFRD